MLGLACDGVGAGGSREVGMTYQLSSVTLHADLHKFFPIMLTRLRRVVVVASSQDLGRRNGSG